MNRAELVREVFSVLRAAGIPGTARELLQTADLLIRSHAGEIGRLSDFGRAVDSRALPLLPVDLALNGNPWRLLEFELSRSGHIELDAAERFEAQARLKRT